jgi:integrase/recombinase XerD
MSVRPHPEQHTANHADKWIIDFKGPDGKRRQIVFTGPESDARRIEQSERIKQRGIAVNRFPSIFEVIHSFIASYQLDHQPKGTERLKDSFKRLLPYFGRYQFQSLSGPLIEQYKRNRIADGVTPSTINKELAALSSLCKWGREQGYCEEVRIKRFPNKLTRAPMMDVPSRKEMVKMLRAIPRGKRAAFAVMYYLGLRSQEARDIRPESVYWARGVVLVVGKGNKQRVVPINRKAAVYLRRLPFYAPGDFRQILKWAAKRIGARTLNPHLFRHAFGCHMTASGVGLRALQEMMGHSSPVITERYSQVVAETLRAEMEKFR